MPSMIVAYPGPPDAVADATVAALSNGGVLLTQRYGAGPPPVTDRVWEYETMAGATAAATRVRNDPTMPPGTVVTTDPARRRYR
jgi:hypothetical protein